ncbi:hypothetical protein ATM97_27795 [Nocardia sp. MH4]|uniref:phage terminase small subunit n=1 Tax=Nocardia sp. MH4 TaxID=1768677 RepID=UPI001C4E4065|nr:hypothetical protein [Nocardia sp. MH4]MBW0275008.1 hypothetical protein [Nocardia sp. MH4]
MPGPPPKPAGQRRRRNKPASHGAAEPVVHQAAVDAPELGYDAHPLVADLWAALVAGSVEGRYFSAADWQRARIELHYLNELLTAGQTPGAMAWAQVQSALNTLLVSPADKRRLGVELERKQVDADEDAAVAQLAEYRDRLSG